MGRNRRPERRTRPKLAACVLVVWAGLPVAANAQTYTWGSWLDLFLGSRVVVEEPIEPPPSVEAEAECVSLSWEDPESRLYERAGALANPDVAPIGGGEGYTDFVEFTGVTVTIDRPDELREKLLAASYGDVVFVPDDIAINLTDESTIVVPEGVTLASDRGQDGSLGALLYSDYREGDLVEPGTDADEKNGPKRWLIRLNEGARITGFRIQGPTLSHDLDASCEAKVRAIQIEGHDNGDDLGVRVDNNEIYGFTNGVDVLNANGVTVDHNHIHHVQRKERTEGCEGYSLGYGVQVSTGADNYNDYRSGRQKYAHATIEANLFDHNRHDIASDGGRGSSYTARYNIVHNARLSHSFDVHEGKYDGNTTPSGVDTMGTEIAGEHFEIHHNTFLHDSFPAVKIRAIPRLGGFIHHNRFVGAAGQTTINQVMDSDFDDVENEIPRTIDPYESIFTCENEYEIGSTQAWFVAPGGASAPLRQPDQTDASTIGGVGVSDDREPGLWRLRHFDGTSMSQVAFGDFDCDGREDAFRTTGSAWEYSPDARGDWKHLNSSSIQLHNLRFGDFDYDGCTDVFRARPQSSTWYVSKGGRGGWDKLNVSSVGVEYLGFGNFDGHEGTDILKANGSSWRISWNGSSSWSHIMNAPYRMEDLAFGDFDADGATDVFYATGSQWWFYSVRHRKWTPLSYSRLTVDRLAFGDFDGDGGTDVFYRSSSSGKWQISWRGATAWEETRTSSYGKESLGFADVNGDGATDILLMQALD